jgi:hypothetical protein
MNHDGLIWKPPFKCGFNADPVSMAEVLWSVQSCWYVLSMYDPSDKGSLESAIEYFIDIGLINEPDPPDVKILSIMTVKKPGPAPVNLVLTMPKDLRSLIFMIAYSDFDILEIYSCDLNLAALAKFWDDEDKLISENTSRLLPQLQKIKSMATASLLWGLPNWESLRNGLLMSNDEIFLSRMKDAIEEYKHLHDQDDHQAILCDAKEELLKYPSL